MLNIKIVGLEALAQKCKADTIKIPLMEGIKKIIFALEGETKKITPVDTGRLRSSIFSRYGASEGIVGTNVEYAPFVEYGTRYMEGSHMFEKGLEQIKHKMADFFKAIGVQIENRWGS